MPLKRHPTPARLRRGIAPLEFVMSLPFLVGVFAMILSVGVLAMHQSTCLVSARHKVWSQRPAPNAASQPDDFESDPTTAFSLLEALKPLGGAVSGKVDSTAQLYFGFGQHVASSDAKVLSNTWDYRNDNAEFAGSGPHFGPLMWMIPAGLLSDIDVLSDLLSMSEGSLPGADEIAKVREQAADLETGANKEKEKADAKYEKEITRLEDEYKTLEGEHEKLVTDRRTLQTKKDGVDREIATLKAKTPRTDAEEERLDKLKIESGELKRDITAKDTAITKKRKEMTAKRNEINRAKQAKQQGQEDLDDQLPGGAGS
jgi:hypothetical protein